MSRPPQHRQQPSSNARQQDDGGSKLDWAQIEKQLHAIPADFKSQKFNSLKRVIEILSRDKPQWALQEVRRPSPSRWRPVLARMYACMRSAADLAFAAHVAQARRACACRAPYM